MIFDTDVLIWFLRGNARASAAIDSNSDRSVSIVSVIELLQGARSKPEISVIRGFLRELHFSALPVTESISHLAVALVEQHALTAGLKLADALIAATAIENDLPLVSGNVRHFRVVQGLRVEAFRPASGIIAG